MTKLQRAVVSAWTACWIMLAMLAGASAAVFAFHARLSEILVRWQGTQLINTAEIVPERD